MKWFYIAIGLFIAMAIINFISSGAMYTGQGQLVSPIHVGADNGQ